ncbi:GPP34 family phosphoprotein [Geodermatophilus sp. YIM 151500]|uniref:GPP34 family phosphoprotein n=1 Tax=Geodermatophilus sp. YIM 151500 TaxID=2984531 RepID=UPI0021E50E2A|nr:GPP34 family phosphoprotein [Geodermatophilus sp. YIM 151500]MCV2491484.1 GPP34 family phosphoprotein [Geodermatophilus sp. YIM 151500]
MTPVDLTGGVAVRLASLCLDARGRLRDFALWDVAVRGALLVDLARADRLAHEDDGITVDAAPTGFPPADRLLAAVEVEPERSLDWWLDHGGVRMRDLAEANLASGRWVVRRRFPGRRYEDVSAVAADDRRLLAGPPPDDGSPGAAAVRVLGLACGAGGRPEPVDEQDLSPTGPLRWICEAVTAHLDVAHRHNLRAAGAADGGSVPYY